LAGLGNSAGGRTGLKSFMHFKKPRSVQRYGSKKESVTGNTNRSNYKTKLRPGPFPDKLNTDRGGRLRTKELVPQDVRV